MNARKILVALSAILLLQGAVAAAPNISVGPATFSGNGSSGFFDVFLTNPGGTEHIAAYTATFTVTPQAGAAGGLSFTGNFATSTANSLYPSQDPSEVSSGGLLGATDSYNTNPFYIIGGDGTALFRANFTVNPSSSGTFDIAFNTTGALRTRLTDDVAATITTTTITNGTITVPEPASAAILLIGMALLGRRKVG